MTLNLPPSLLLLPIKWERRGKENKINLPLIRLSETRYEYFLHLTVDKDTLIYVVGYFHAHGLVLSRMHLLPLNRPYSGGATYLLI